MKPLRFFLAAACIASHAALAETRITDDAGRTLVLKQPASRIISLAPHVTELLFAAGAGERIVGAVQYSDYPPAALRIPRIGDSGQLDLERIVSLKPDLVIAWHHGNSQAQVERLVQLGIPVFNNEPHRLADVARSIEQFGRLAGTPGIAGAAARNFAARQAALRSAYAGRAAVNVFFQIWERPLMTVNEQHLISDVIGLCGGHNVFQNLKSLVPVVSAEDVLAADPEVIVGSESKPDWSRWPRLSAVSHGNVFSLPSELIDRPTPRILQGAQQLCEDLQSARARR